MHAHSQRSPSTAARGPDSHRGPSGNWLPTHQLSREWGRTWPKPTAQALWTPALCLGLRQARLHLFLTGGAGPRAACAAPQPPCVGPWGAFPWLGENTTSPSSTGVVSLDDTDSIANIVLGILFSHFCMKDFRVQRSVFIHYIWKAFLPVLC